MKKVLFLFGIAAVAVVIWKTAQGQRKSDLRDRVNTWENEGGYVLGVPLTRNGG